MNDTTDAPAQGLLKSAGRVGQWIVFAFLVVFVIGAATELRKAGVPGAPVALLYIMAAAITGLAIAHLPAVFSRFPRAGRIAAYVAIIPAIILYYSYGERMRPVWEKTPEGAVEAAADRQAEAAREEADKKAAAEQAQRDATAKSLAEGQAAIDKLAEVRRRLEGCFSTFGHRLPALEDPIKAALHNPDSFEHVETVLIVPDANRNNVAITFRAQNGFGAIRTATARAQLIAEDCSVQNIGEPETN